MRLTSRGTGSRDTNTAQCTPVMLIDHNKLDPLLLPKWVRAVHLLTLLSIWAPGKLENWWKKKTLAVSLAALDCGTDGFVVLNVYGYGCVLFCPFPVQKKHTIKGSKLTKCFLEKVWTEHLHYKMYHSCFRKTFVWVCSLVSFSRSSAEAYYQRSPLRKQTAKMSSEAKSILENWKHDTNFTKWIDNHSCFR